MKVPAGVQLLLASCAAIVISGCQSPSGGNGGGGAGGGVTSEDVGGAGTGGGPETGGGRGTGGGLGTGGGPGTGGGGGVLPDAGMCAAVCSSGSLCCQVSMLNDVPESQRTFECLTAPSGVCPAPDLIVDRDRMLNHYVETRTFGANSCALGEQCVNASGTRRLLRFPTMTINQGQRDLTLGVPTQRPDLFQFDSCHKHYHFSKYASYRLLRGDGTVVGTGRKQSFCLADNLHFSGSQTSPQFNCDHQGISAGWGDEYEAKVDCQWIDVTEVPPGNYVLEINVNPDRLLLEGNYVNNVSSVPVTIR